MKLNSKKSLQQVSGKIFHTIYDSYYVFIENGNLSALDYYSLMKRDRRLSVVLIGDSNQDGGIHFFIQTHLPEKKSEVRAIMYDYIQFWNFDVEPCTKNKIKHIFANSKQDCYATANFKLMESHPREKYVLTYINPSLANYGSNIYHKMRNNSVIHDLWLQRSPSSDYKYLKMYFSISLVLSHSAITDFMKDILGCDATFCIESIEEYPVLSFDGSIFAHNIYREIHGDVECNESDATDYDGGYISEIETPESSDAGDEDSVREPFA